MNDVAKVEAGSQTPPPPPPPPVDGQAPQSPGGASQPPVLAPAPTVLELVLLGALTVASIVFVRMPLIGLLLGLGVFAVGLVQSRRGRGSRRAAAATLAVIGALVAVLCATLLLFFVSSHLEERPGETVEVDS